MSWDEVIIELTKIVWSKRKVIFLVIIPVLLAIATVIFFSNFAVLDIKILSKISGKDISIYTSSDQGIKKIGSDGVVIVPRNTTSIIASSSVQNRTQSRVAIPWYGFLAIQMKLAPDKDAEKVAFRSSKGDECATYAKNIKSLLYYDCDNARNLTRYITPSNGLWREKNIATLSYTGNRAVPYMGGVLGVSYLPATDKTKVSDITYTTSNGKFISFDAPNGVGKSQLLNSRIFTDSSTSNKRFIFVSRDGDTFLATPSSNFSSIAYTKIPAPDRYDDNYNQTLCTLNDANVYCLYTRQVLGDLSSSFDLNTVAAPSVIKASFDNDTVDTSSLDPVVETLDGFYATNSGDLFTLRHRQLDFLRSTTDGYKPINISHTVDTASGGNRLLYVQEKGVFEVNLPMLDAYQVFYSSNIDAKSIYQTEDSVFIIGSTGSEKSDSFTYAYQLLERDNPGNRPIDKLPFESSKVDLILTNDFIGNTFFARIYTPFKPPSSIRGVDAGLISKIKNDLRDYLLGIGVSIDKIQLSL